METRDLDENTILDLDAQGNIRSITIEHASQRADLPHLSYEQVAAKSACIARLLDQCEGGVGPSSAADSRRGPVRNCSVGFRHALRTKAPLALTPAHAMTSRHLTV